MTITHAVTCPRCAGECYLENAVAECGDRTRLCETCNASGHVPARWAAMYAAGHDDHCDYCGEPIGAAWDGELYTCVACWGQRYERQQAERDNCPPGDSPRRNPEGVRFR